MTRRELINSIRTYMALTANLTTTLNTEDPFGSKEERAALRVTHATLNGYLTGVKAAVFDEENPCCASPSA